MAHSLSGLRDLADDCLLWSLAPLGIYILLTGLDDLFIDIVWLYSWLRRIVMGRPRVHVPSEDELAIPPEKRIAVFVPLWHEDEVIGEMLAHNIAAVRYQNYDFFVGAYPNDAGTIEAVREAEARFSNVHLAVCPHDGPTSKADCLNWIYQRMLMAEELNGNRFDVVVTHDAEDLMHPEALRWINHYTGDYGFVQIPVLALATPVLNLTHGVYCDEFAEFQSRDLPVRNFMGGFVPSAGVGTAYSREALEALALSAANRIFEPGCLTEDYENGYRLHELGFRQIFVPIVRRGSFVATREYFPSTMAAAIQQRTRWITGIALQGWARHRWRGGPLQIYWLWRDRKGLISNPLSLATNLVCGYAAAVRLWERASPPSYLLRILSVTFALHLVRTAVRLACTSRVYGFGFALLAPVRSIAANVINSAAVVRAAYRFARARWRGEALVWVKTEHAYPSRAALLPQHRPIGEILVGSGYIEPDDLEEALATKPAGLRIGEHLVALGKLTEDELYEALSLQQDLPLITLDLDTIAQPVARALPADLSERWKVLPFRIESGWLNVASPEMPVNAMEVALREHTGLEIRVHLVTPMQYRELERRLAGECAGAIAG